MSEANNNPAVEAIRYALNQRAEGIDFLRLWFEGEFQVIREEWPDCPDEVFEGADPLFKKSKS